MQMYLVETKTTCDADKMWLMNFRSKYACPECRMRYRQTFAQAIDVVIDEPPGSAAINCVAPPFINFVRCDFLELFADVLQEDMHLGRVFRHGKLLEQYQTITSENRLIIRGQERVYTRTCPSCGGFIYWPGEPCGWYVLRSLLIDKTFYMSSEGGFIMTGELRTRIEKGRWKGILISKLPVLDAPRDGLEEIPETLMF